MDFNFYKGPDLPPYKYKGTGPIEGNQLQSKHKFTLFCTSNPNLQFL